MGLLGALVGEDEADVGLIGGDGGDAGVHVHVVINGDIVPAIGGQRHVPLAEHGVQEAVVILPVVIVLLHDDVGGVHPVHPAGHFLIVLAFAGDGVDQHGALHVRAAEEADGLDQTGAHPVGGAGLVDLKDRLVEHVGGVVEPQVAVQVAAEVLRRGVLHAVLQAHHLRLLGHHVDDDVGGQAGGAVGEPLDEVAVGQGGHPHGAALVVDLVIGGQDLELGDHVAQLAQLAAAQASGGVGVQHGDLVVGDLLDVSGEIAGLNGQELAVCPGPEHYPGGDGAQGDGGDQRQKDEEGHHALLFYKAHVTLHALALEPGGEDGADAVYRAQEEDKYIEIFGVEVQGGQLRVKIHQAEYRGHSQVDERAGKGIADGLAGLAGPPLGRRCGGTGTGLLEPAGEPAEIEYKGHERISFPG